MKDEGANNAHILQTFACNIQVITVQTGYQTFPTHLPRFQSYSCVFACLEDSTAVSLTSLTVCERNNLHYLTFTFECVDI